MCQEADSRMKEHVDRLFGKLRSSKGETLAELLVSVLVIVLGLTMFATAMMSSKKMLVKGDAVMQAYYTQRNILEGEDVNDFVVFSFPFTGREFLWSICFYSQDG